MREVAPGGGQEPVGGGRAGVGRGARLRADRRGRACRGGKSREGIFAGQREMLRGKRDDLAGGGTALRDDGRKGQGQAHAQVP